MAKRLVKATQQQIDMMVDFMTAHECLVLQMPLRERVKHKKNSDRLWGELCATLNNNTFGPKKTIQKWKKVWSDLRMAATRQIKLKQNLKGYPKYNPSYTKIRNLLEKVASQRALVEQQDQSVSSLDPQERNILIKFEESNSYQHSEIESNREQPYVISIQSLGPQPTETQSRKFVKCEAAAENDSSDEEILIPCAPTPTVNSNEDTQSFEDTVNSTTPAFNNTNTRSKRKNTHVTEDTHLRNLIEVEKEKSGSLLAVAKAISSSNETQEKLLKIEEERNRLIQQRNIIESERNDLFKSLLEHLKAKDIL